MKVDRNVIMTGERKQVMLRADEGMKIKGNEK